MLIRNSFLFLLIILLLARCEGVNDFHNHNKQISLSTNASLYSENDTICLSLENKLASSIEIGLRCGDFLEMFYQRKEKDQWSDNMWFGYMSLRCFTVLDTIEANSTFAHSVPAKAFGSTGIFRLLVNYHFLNKDTGGVVISNPFEIK